MKPERGADGITADRFQDITIPLDNRYADGRARSCGITVARGDSGSWYVGYDLRLGDSGSCHGPFAKFSEKYTSRDDAVIAGARLIQALIFKSKKPNGKLEQRMLAALDEVISIHQPPPPMEKPKKGFIFGWKYGGNGYQLYIQIYPKQMDPKDKPAGYAKCSWGVTARIEDAFRFKTLAACLDKYRSQHAWPEEYEANLWNGHVQFFQVTDTGVHRVFPTEQPSLF